MSHPTIDITEVPVTYEKSCFIRLIPRNMYNKEARIATVQLCRSELAPDEVKLNFVPKDGDVVFFVVEVWIEDGVDDEIKVRHGYRDEWDALHHEVYVRKAERLYVDVETYVWMGVVGQPVAGWI